MSAANPSSRAITVQQIDGVWWLVDTEGQPFVSVGVNHIQSDCFLAPYNKEHMLATYGDDLANKENRFNAAGQGIRRLMEANKERLNELGFNSLGMHTFDVPTDAFADDLYYCVAIDAFPLGSRYRFQEQTFPDIFSEDFEVFLDNAVRDKCLEHSDNERFIGYAFSDIPRWYFFGGKKPNYEMHPWTLDLLSQPAGTAGKEAVIEVLRARYESPHALSEVYPDVVAETWEEVAAVSPWPTPPPHPQADADSDAILAHTVERWYSLHTTLIRRYDESHLILGDKLHSPHILPEWFKPILKRYVDVTFIQWYTPVETQRETLQHLYDVIGKPILNGDSCFGCAKPPHQTKVKGYKVESQAAVGRAYADYLEGVMRLPFMLGWHHCGFVEQWDGGKMNNWEINENGFYDPFEKPYPEITDPVSVANHAAHRWHAGS